MIGCALANQQAQLAEHYLVREIVEAASLETQVADAMPRALTEEVLPVWDATVIAD